MVKLLVGVKIVRCITLVAALVGFVSRSSAGMLHVGEELIYNVSYLSISLGTIRIAVTDSVIKEGTVYYKAKAYINSREGLPFANLHSIYETLLNNYPLYSEDFIATDRQSDGTWKYWKYFYDYKNLHVRIEEGVGKNIIQSWDLPIVPQEQDGLSLFFYARAHIHEKKKVVVPGIIMNKPVKTMIDFEGEREPVEIDAITYPVDCIHFEGLAHFVGIYGLTGKFEGWFSNDEAAVPMKATMQVYLGNITIELVKYRRDGWVPPCGVQ